jgi:hypothetical protein
MDEYGVSAVSWLLPAQVSTTQRSRHSRVRGSMGAAAIRATIRVISASVAARPVAISSRISR